MIALTLRYKSDDQFWFTFFHEAGHIFLHGKSRVFIDGTDHGDDTLEEEADTFARDFLVPPEKYKAFISRQSFYADSINRYAATLGIVFRCWSEGSSMTGF